MYSMAADENFYPHPHWNNLIHKSCQAVEHFFFPFVYTQDADMLNQGELKNNTCLLSLANDDDYLVVKSC